MPREIRGRDGKLLGYVETEAEMEGREAVAADRFRRTQKAVSNWAQRMAGPTPAIWAMGAIGFPLFIMTQAETLTVGWRIAFSALAAVGCIVMMIRDLRTIGRQRSVSQGEVAPTDHEHQQRGREAHGQHDVESAAPEGIEPDDL